MAFVRLAVPGAVVAAFATCFAWAGGGVIPGRVDETRMIAAFEANSGPQPGFRRNHAKGICLSGWFDGNGAGLGLSKAQVFRPGRVPVFGRFSLAGGRPARADGPNVARSMALHFALPNGEAWRTAMNDTPVFPVRDAQGFYDNLIAVRPDPATGKPDPARIAAFLEAHPELARALALIKAHPVSSGFDNATYNSLNAFHLVDFGRQRHAGPLVDGARRCLRAATCRTARGQELSVRRSRRAPPAGPGTMALAAHDRPSGRSDE